MSYIHSNHIIIDLITVVYDFTKEQTCLLIIMEVLSAHDTVYSLG